MGVEREQACLPAALMGIDGHGAQQCLVSQVHPIEVSDA
jgi:hypothetical protein